MEEEGKDYIIQRQEISNRQKDIERDLKEEESVFDSNVRSFIREYIVYQEYKSRVINITIDPDQARYVQEIFNLVEKQADGTILLPRILNDELISLLTRYANDEDISPIVRIQAKLALSRKYLSEKRTMNLCDPLLDEAMFLVPKDDEFRVDRIRLIQMNKAWFYDRLDANGKNLDRPALLALEIMRNMFQDDNKNKIYDANILNTYGLILKGTTCQNIGGTTADESVAMYKRAEKACQMYMKEYEEIDDELYNMFKSKRNLIRIHRGEQTLYDKKSEDYEREELVGLLEDNIEERFEVLYSCEIAAKLCRRLRHYKKMNELLDLGLALDEQHPGLRRLQAQTKQKPRKPCRFYQNGNCRRGTECNYAHV